MRVLQEQMFLQFAGPEHSVCFNTIRKTKELSNHLWEATAAAHQSGREYYVHHLYNAYNPSYNENDSSKVENIQDSNQSSQSWTYHNTLYQLSNRHSRGVTICLFCSNRCWGPCSLRINHKLLCIAIIPEATCLTGQWAQVKHQIYNKEAEK